VSENSRADGSMIGKVFVFYLLELSKYVSGLNTKYNAASSDKHDACSNSVHFCRIVSRLLKLVKKLVSASSRPMFIVVVILVVVLAGRARADCRLGRRFERMAGRWRA